MKKENYYFDINNDYEQYPDAFIYIEIGGRNRGKTYSALQYEKSQGERFVFVKRTNTDVSMMCAGAKRYHDKVKEGDSQIEFNISPFVPLNRDKGYNVYPVTIPKVEGVAGFWDCDTEGNPYGLPVGYIVSLNAVEKVKGFDMSDTEQIIFDEFIPKKYERVSHSEGDQILELYKTVSRDREHRGRKPLKLILLANAVSISNPVLEAFNLVDTIADMCINEQEYLYLEKRRILIHLIEDSPEFYEKEAQSAIYIAMEGTAWCEMALNNNFSYDDMTNIDKKVKIKGFKCIGAFYYNKKDFFIYRKGKSYVVNNSRYITDKYYDLETDNGQHLFYDDFIYDLKDATIHGYCKYNSYAVYNLVMNYKKIFTI